MITFIVGLFIGFYFGIVVICFCIASSEGDK